MPEIVIKSSKKDEFIDITFDVQDYLNQNSFKDGMIFLNTLHTTAALTINENADADVKTDLVNALNALVPNINLNILKGIQMLI